MPETVFSPPMPFPSGRRTSPRRRLPRTPGRGPRWAAAAALLGGLILAALPLPARAEIAVCNAASQSDRKATCVLEGDMGIEDGLPWILLDVDAPAIANPGCAAEKLEGEQARDRLLALMAPGYQILDSGRRDRTQRARVHIQLADGRDAGSVLIAEDLARPWRSKGNIWCGW